MSERIEKSKQLHKLGYNCSQAVFCSYCDLFGIEEKYAFQIAEGFGAGMGIQSVCGALTGLFMLAGLNNSSGTPEILTKASTYKLTKELAQKFQQNIGSIFCNEIKGLTGIGPLKSCDECITCACLIFEEYIKNNKLVIIK